MALWTRITGLIGGGAVATAAGTAFAPVYELERQYAWQKSSARILDLNTLASLVAQGLVAEDKAALEAERNGYTPGRLNAAVQLQLRAAPVAELLELWRRGKITVELVDHGLAKAQIEPQYWPALKELEFARLSPEDVAVMVQRGILANASDPDIPGPILPVGPPTATGKVPPMPMVDLDPFKEAFAEGASPRRVAALARIVGLPASPDLAARMTFRQIIERVDFDRAISEGNTRNEWAPFLFEAFRDIPTAHDFVEGHLRGWITEAQMYEGTARHGMSREDTGLLFKDLGRPLAVHQVTTGLARGGVFGGDYAGVPEPFLSALRQSNVRPEWGNIAYANRYSYSVPFWWRALVTSGALTEAEGEKILLELGNRPDLAKLVAQHFAATPTATADKHVPKAQTQLWNAIHRSYVGYKATDARTHAVLAELGLTAAEQSEVVRLWQHERDLTRADLTDSAIRKAYGLKIFTRDEAVTRLVEKGMSAADADVYLKEL